MHAYILEIVWPRCCRAALRRKETKASAWNQEKNHGRGPVTVTQLISKPQESLIRARLYK